MNLLCPSFPLTIVFFLFFIYSTTQCMDTLSSSSPSTETIINQTCNSCAANSQVNYSFCLSSLLSSDLPAIPNADLSDLAIASMFAAKENATSTVSTINHLLENDELDPYAKSCLQDCLELYEDGYESLEEAMKAFCKSDYATANVRLSAAMDAAGTCENGFDEGDIVSPLQRENYFLFQLSDIALCIVNMLSSSGFHQVMSSS